MLCLVDFELQQLYRDVKPYKLWTRNRDIVSDNTHTLLLGVREAYVFAFHFQTNLNLLQQE